MKSSTMLFLAPASAIASTPQTAATSSPFTNLWWTVAAGFIGALFALVLKHFYDGWQGRKTRDRRKQALLAEVDFCARLARTYILEPFTAPLYRFPDAVFKSVFSQLATDAFEATGIHALTGFYSLVDQMNRGLDAVERYRSANDADRAMAEVNRLLLKASQMQHPTDASREPGQELNYYAGAVAALKSTY